MESSHFAYKNKVLRTQDSSTQTEKLLIFRDRKDLHEFIRRYNHLLDYRDESSQTEQAVVPPHNDSGDSTKLIRDLIHEELSRMANLSQLNSSLFHQSSAVPTNGPSSQTQPVTAISSCEEPLLFSSVDQVSSVAPVVSLSSSTSSSVLITSVLKKNVSTEGNSQMNSPGTSSCIESPDANQSSSDLLPVPDHWMTSINEREKTSIKVYQKLLQRRNASNVMSVFSNANAKGNKLSSILVNQQTSSSPMNISSRTRHRRLGRKFRERTQPLICIPNHRIVMLRSPQEVRPTEGDEEFRIHKEEVGRVFQEACSIGNFGWRLASLVYTCEELWDRNWGGTHGKRPLSPRRLHAIEHVFYEYFPIEKQASFLNEGRAAINQGVRNLMYGHAGKYIQFSTPSTSSNNTPTITSVSGSGVNNRSEDESSTSTNGGPVLKRPYPSSSCWESENPRNQIEMSMLGSNRLSLASVADEIEDKRLLHFPSSLHSRRGPTNLSEWSSSIPHRRDTGMPPSTRYNLLSPVGSNGTQWSPLTSHSSQSALPSQFLNNLGDSDVVNLVEDEDEDMIEEDHCIQQTLLMNQSLSYKDSFHGDQDIKPVLPSTTSGFL